MGKIRQITDSAFFVPSYSDQTIQPAYSTQTTVQYFGIGVEAEESARTDDQEKPDQK
jgi:hypothetical protein